MEEFKTSKAAAMRLRNYLRGEYGTPIVLKDKSEFEWREFIVVPADKELRKAFIVSYEANIHNTTAENLIQSYPDKNYSVSVILNSNPPGRVWVDMTVDEFIARAGIKIDLQAFV
jgi:hypothetical protein